LVTVCILGRESTDRGLLLVVDVALEVGGRADELLIFVVDTQLASLRALFLIVFAEDLLIRRCIRIHDMSGLIISTRH
jgi:hypothetical protein